MFKSNGRHARKRARWVGPLFAVDALLVLLVLLATKREFDAASARQRGES